MTDPYVAALLHERAGYKKAGLKDRLKAVDAELARLGVTADDAPETAVNAAPEKAVRPRGRPRKVQP